MKANTVNTALEILTAAKIADAETVFGKLRVRIAGIPGIVKPDHLINFQPGTKEIDIIVGDKSYKLALEGDEAEKKLSDTVKTVKVARGVELKKKSEALQAAKKEAKEKAKKEPVEPEK